MDVQRNRGEKGDDNNKERERERERDTERERQRQRERERERHMKIWSNGGRQSKQRTE